MEYVKHLLDLAMLFVAIVGIFQNFFEILTRTEGGNKTLYTVDGMCIVRAAFAAFLVYSALSTREAVYLIPAGMLGSRGLFATRIWSWEKTFK